MLSTSEFAIITHIYIYIYYRRIITCFSVFLLEKKILEIKGNATYVKEFYYFYNCLTRMKSLITITLIMLKNYDWSLGFVKGKANWQNEKHSKWLCKCMDTHGQITYNAFSPRSKTIVLKKEKKRVFFIGFLFKKKKTLEIEINIGNIKEFH